MTNKYYSNCLWELLKLRWRGSIDKIVVVKARIFPYFHFMGISKNHVVHFKTSKENFQCRPFYFEGYIQTLPKNKFKNKYMRVL